MCPGPMFADAWCDACKAPTDNVVVQFCARGSMFDVLAKARSSPLLAQQLDWPKRVSMALDAAKVGLHI